MRKGDGHCADVEVLPADALLSAIVASSDDAIVSKTLEGRITSWNASAERLFGYSAAEVLGQPISILAAPGRDEMPAILEKIRRGERIDHYDTVRRRKDGSVIEVSLTISPIRDAGGRIIGASKIARDISERKRMEERQETLLHELNHRVKNTLAAIQSIAHETGERAGTVREFLVSFDGRLGAMAAAHDLLVTGDFQGAALEDIARRALRPHVDEESGRLRLTLPSAWLGSSLALNVALVLHELACNAAKYGALSSPLGRVLLEGWLEAPDLVLVWRELGGPGVRAPTRRGFGTTLLTGVTRQHGGRVHLDWRREGLICTLVLRLGPQHAPIPAERDIPAPASMPPAPC